MYSISTIKIERVTNTFFHSASYVVYSDEEDRCAVVDCGDVAPLVEIIKSHSLSPVAVLLTHAHFDHIYGLNEFLSLYPNCEVYCSSQAQIGLSDPRLNYSRYQAEDFSYNGKAIVLVDGQEIELWSGCKIHAIATPGHDVGCMTYVVGDRIFTGDSLIPGVKTVTNLRGNKQQAKESEQKILSLVSDHGLSICPGHVSDAEAGTVEKLLLM